MARKKGFSSYVNEMARASGRAEREREQREKAHARELEKARREHARLETQNLKDQKQRYLEDRIQEVEDTNAELQERLHELASILETTFNMDDTISFSTLRSKEKFRRFQLPSNLEQVPEAPKLETFQARVTKPSGISRMVPGTVKKYEDSLKKAEAEYQQAVSNHQIAIQQREQRIAWLRSEYDTEKQKFDADMLKRNEEVDEFERAYHSGDPTAVLAYCNMVLERSAYPSGFPNEFRTAYVPESKELIVEYELPDVSLVPTVSEYSYLKAKDEIKHKERKAADIKAQYQDIVASVCLRTVHELFEADQAGHLEVVVFNGFVQTVDPATGRDVRPHLISLRTTKERFGEVNLARVDKRICLRNLGAQISPRPAEMQAVKPVVDFDMVDKRFVEQSDILSDIESRPNLMELSPFEFENFVSNLFDQIGFESKLTRSSKDGGVDVVAFDPRPIVGGKVVIQAKRYRHVVGVSAVRDMYGTMINEGAGKGVLVTTSHYGPDAYEFAKGKPIELIDGGGLLYLLEQQGIKARIVFPEG